MLYFKQQKNAFKRNKLYTLQGSKHAAGDSLTLFPVLVTDTK